MATLLVSRVHGTPLYSIGGYFSKALIRAASGVDFDTKERVQHGIPGMKFNPAAKRYEGYVDAVELVVERLRCAGVGVNAEALGTRQVGSPYTPAVADLWKHQAEGVHWLLAHAQEGAVLADEMGCGKTAQALRAARAFKGRTLIVCPQRVRGVWAGSGFLSRKAQELPADGEVKKWWPDAVFLSQSDLLGPSPRSSLYVCKGTAPGDAETYDLQHAQVVICHSEILHAWTDTLRPLGFKTVLFDEGHLYLTNPTSRWWKACAAVAESIPYKIVLTGTPMTNRPKDLYGLVSAVSPGRFGEKPFPFYLAYCDARQEEVGSTPETKKTVWNYKGSSNEEELRKRCSRIILRRLKDQVEGLPEMTWQTIDLEVASKFHSSAASAITGKSLNGAAVRRQLAAAADGKVPQVAAAVAGYVEEGSKVVVFTYRREVAETIADGLRADGINALWVHGGLAGPSGMRERERRIRAEPDVLCCTIDSAGVGISLAYADVAGFAELTYEPQEILQAVSRVHRPGARRNVKVVCWIASHTTDELVRDVVLRKIATFKKIVGEGGVNAGLGADLAKGRETYSEAMHRMYLQVMKHAEPVKVKKTKAR